MSPFLFCNKTCNTYHQTGDSINGKLIRGAERFCSARCEYNIALHCQAIVLVNTSPDR